MYALCCRFVLCFLSLANCLSFCEPLPAAFAVVFPAGRRLSICRFSKSRSVNMVGKHKLYIPTLVLLCERTWVFCCSFISHVVIVAFECRGGVWGTLHTLLQNEARSRGLWLLASMDAELRGPFICFTGKMSLLIATLLLNVPLLRTFGVLRVYVLHAYPKSPQKSKSKWKKKRYVVAF